MEQTGFNARYEGYRQAVEQYLSGLFTEKTDWPDLYESMRYSLLAGGKRIRPVLTLEFARLAGMDWKAALPAACALELVHTYSLIHDDLPCMDDDDLRRGKPTNHKVYGETLAVLAGDALQPEAYRLILTAPGLGADRRADCALVLAEAAGADGMVAGQVLDTLHAPETEAELTEVHRLKTGCMIRAACAMGCAAAGASQTLGEAAGVYAENLGLAFQIRDDMLDVIGDEATFGKPIGSDREEGKVTFVDLLGVEGCAAAVRNCTEKAKAAVAAYDADGFLSALADSLAERKK
ncbi:polyprenyl synthetase family protein [uncultured Dysosmobacter sp.]|uniref:polyprenyl synthetase family protein n=1 Tax=uncultured Dysosmobacter sp. TaxID=2591384 RepID=UPI00262EB3A8|nr:farnesyl diphosphate synthase [uncultured Dysosmobacter sp.]